MWPGSVLAAFLACASVATGSAQSATPPNVHEQLDALFNKHAYAVKGIQLAWQKDGEIYTILEPGGGKGMDIVAYDSASGKRSVLISAVQLTPKGAKAPLDIDEYAWSDDRKKLLFFTNTRKVWRLNTRGDYWVFDEASGTLTKLGGDAPESSLMFASFSPDGTRVAWVRANNLYVEDLATQKITQLTNDGSADIINGTSDWVNEEELELRDCFRWSPDGQSIAYWQFDQSGVGEYTLINDTAGEYPTTFTYKYPQPGTTNAAVRAGVVPAAGGPTTWIKLEGDPRQHYIARMEWAGNSREVLLEYLDRLQQHNQVMLADAHSGDARLFFEDDDKAWVDVVPLTFLGKGGEKEPDLLWLSERDGWSHAYRIDRTSGQPRLITNFAGDVISVEAVDAAGGWLYFIASPDDPIRRYLYRSRLDGSGAPERVTPAALSGNNHYNIAPNGHFAVHQFSTFIKPPDSEVVSLPDHKVLRTLVSNEAVSKKVKELLPAAPEFFKAPVGNGVTLDGWMIKPPNFDPAKKYPVLTFVYGEPASATVRDAWSGGTGLFHAIIAQQGYLVVSFDNEGTPSPKGREWRKCIYGAVGVLSSAQQAQAIQWLAKQRSYIDSSRMAIWGHSGGGSQTLNVMFRYPNVYSTGISASPVPDESHYDTIYQERYMGLPDENKQGYHDGSPINFAAGLKGHLLLIHGSGDDNVHYQGSELLINRLIELDKQFDFFDYPNRSHCLCEGKGTTYHWFSTMTRYLEDHVPPGPR
ncbi:S9 family peptidase [Acidobacteria bacterium AB60]|nr:S9 family peptidase [Acidobacteria bacterium AB60]